MAELADGIAQYLDGLNILVYDPTGITGDTFIDTLPPTPDNAVALTLYGLGEPDPLNSEDEDGLQVRVRCGPDPRPGRALSDAIYSALQGLSDTELPGGRWLMLCTAIQRPASIGTDETGRHEYVTNYRIHSSNPTAHRI